MPGHRWNVGGPNSFSVEEDPGIYPAKSVSVPLGFLPGLSEITPLVSLSAVLYAKSIYMP